MMNRQKTIYVVPSWHCNLHCPHCFVHLQEDLYDKEIFLSTLKKLKIQYPNASFILHGGEPTLHKDRYYDIISTGIINSICSNLIIDREILIDINNRDISIATSWNPYRFNSEKYQEWINNIKLLNNKPLILITLDQDLINYDINNFINFLQDMIYIGIQDILFEPLVDNTLDDIFQQKVDEWLCDLHVIWKNNNIKLNNLIEYQILNWNFRCDSLTLHPDGSIKKGCILGSECYKLLNKCLKCEFSGVCLPCVLHSRCSFYPKFYNLIKTEMN